MSWLRPFFVPVGQVWLRFKGRDRDGIPGKWYQIRDVGDKYREDCLDLMMEHFVRDEPLCQVLGIKSDPESLKQIRLNWLQILNEQISLACFTDEDGEPGELVAAYFLYTKSIGDEEDVHGVQGEKWRQLYLTLTAVEDLVDVFQHYNVDTCICGSVMSVLPKYRGQNIGARLIEASEHLCKVLKIGAICTSYTASTSQALANKCGHELLAEMPYERMLEHGIDLRQCETKTVQLRGKKIT